MATLSLTFLRFSFLVVLTLGLFFMGSRPAPVYAGTYTVSRTDDPTPGACNPGDCSLREAIIAANAAPGDDTINLPAGTYTLSIAGTGEDAAATGDLDVTEDVTVSGAGAATTIIDGGGIDRVFDIDPGLNFTGGQRVQISAVTIRHGSVGVGAAGGGVATWGSVTLEDATVTGNVALGGGGGIYVFGGLWLLNSTVSGNTASHGGGIYIEYGGSALDNSTISGNTGGGISVELYGGATLSHATVSSNTGTGIQVGSLANATLGDIIIADNSGGDCDAYAGITIASYGHNLDSDGSCPLTAPGDLPNANPWLGPLAYNGGPTKTHALLPGSPAIDAGSNDCYTPPTDQRGVARPQGSACDIGAYEFQPPVMLAPASVSWGDGRIDVFARGSDNSLWYRFYVRDRGWYGWNKLGGVLNFGPDVASWAEGRLDVFALGTGNKLWHRSYARGQGWTNWRSLGAPAGLTLTSDPGVVSWGKGRIDVFARASDNSLWHRSYVQDSGWSIWERLGGALHSGPDVSSWAEGRLDVFALGTDNKLWHKSYARGHGWSGWRSLEAPGGLTLTSDPGAVSWGDGRIDVFARGSDNSLWHRWYVRGHGWYGWVKLGGVLSSGPDVASWAKGRLDVFALGVYGKFWHRSYVNGHGWSAWKKLGGS